MDEGYIPGKLSKSLFNRRLQNIQDLVITLFDLPGETRKELNGHSAYVINNYTSLVAIILAFVSRAATRDRNNGEGLRSVKKRYFYEVKIHILFIEHGQPVEFLFTPGGYSDTRAYCLYDFDLPDQAWTTGEKAYNDNDVEDAMIEVGLRMRPMRKEDSKRNVKP